jgi:hypothetical protein
MEKLHVLWILGWALLRSMLASVFRVRRGLRAFQESYAGDGLPAVSPAERRVLPTLSGCIACGACDVGAGPAIAASHGMFAGVMDLILASSRSMPDFDVAARSFDAIGDDRLEELEGLCPARVPMRKVAAFVRAKGRDLARLPR